MYRFLVLALVSAGASVQAASFGFNAAGTDSNANPVGASAIFSILDAHDFTATLSDTEGSILDFQQLIEGLKLGFSGAGGPGTADSGGNSGPSSDPPINFSFALDPPAVPEPATWLLTGAVLLGFAFCRKRPGGNR